MTSSRTAIPRDRISVGLATDVRPTLRSVAGGRVIVIDCFASHRCGLTIGDLTAHFQAAEPGPGYAELWALEGVRLFAQMHLLNLLAAAGVTLRWRGSWFARRLALELDRPELWLEFLEQRWLTTRNGVARWTR